MYGEFRVFIERCVALHTEVIGVFGQSLEAAMLLMTDRTVGHSLGHSERIVIVLALVMTALAITVVNGTDVIVEPRQSCQRLPRCLMAAFAIGLSGLVACRDGPRQIDRVVALQSEHRDEDQRYQPTHDRDPTPTPMQTVRDAIDMQIESLDNRRVST